MTKRSLSDSGLPHLSAVLMACVLFGCAVPIQESSGPNESDFEVENGVLVRYKGPIVFDLVVPAIVRGQAVTTIGSGAFDDRYGSHVTLPEGITNIEPFAFSSPLFLQVDLPSTLKTIGEGAFASSSLTAATIPNGVTSIGEIAFVSCARLYSVLLPESLTTIADEAFRDCYHLLQLTLPAGLTAIGDSAFLGCTALQGVAIPDSVQSIGNGAFFGCDSLAAVIFPDALTTLGISPFSGCDLVSVDLPAGVTSVGVDAFANNNRLSSARFRGSGLTGSESHHVFSAAAPDLVLTVPADSLDAYRASWGTASSSGLTDSQIVSD